MRTAPKELPDRQISFSSNEPKLLEVKCDDVQFSLNGESIEDYPLFPMVLEDAFMEFEVPALRGMIDKTMNAICHDLDRYEFNGIFTKHIVLPDGSDCLELAATDGKRLAVISGYFTGIIYSKLDDGIIIPTKGIIELRKLFNVSDGELQYCFIEDSIVFRNENTCLVVRLIDGKFPEYKRSIPNNISQPAVIDKVPFIQPLRRIIVHSGDKQAALKLELSSDNLCISWCDSGIGEIKERINIKYDGDLIESKFNATYLIDALEGVESERVEISINNGILVVASTLKSDSFIGLVMSMR